MRLKSSRLILAAVALVCGATAAIANDDQNPVDQADPSVVEEELRHEAREAPRTGPILEAPRPRPAESEVGEPVLVGAVRVEGADALPPATFAPVIERYAGRTLSPTELKALASDIAAIVRDAGYGLATAWIPEQRISNGVLRVKVDEGHIDGIDVSGSAAAAVEPFLRGIAGPKPVRTAELERQLLLADDVPGVRLGKARLLRRFGRNVLVLEATRERVEVRASVDNWGSSTAGPIRARLAVDVNALVTNDDRLSIDGVVTPLQPGEFGLVRVVYSTSLGTRGTELSAGGYIARSEAGGALAGRDLDGRSSEIQVELRHPIIRSRSGSLWAGLDARARESHQRLKGVPLREDHLTTLSATLYGTRRMPHGRIRGRAALTRGLDLFGSTDAGDALSSRTDADGTFTKAELWAEYEHDLGGGFSFAGQAEGQLADGPLLSSDEMGLGGRYFGRAWDYREFSGDRGIAGMIELRYDWRKPIQGIQVVQLYTYADGGAVDNYGVGRGGGSLASSGGGVRLSLGSGFKAGFELGVPLTDGSDPADPDNPRFSFTLDKRF
jgi:hemolysin activation/secretion protein